MQNYDQTSWGASPPSRGLSRRSTGPTAARPMTPESQQTPQTHEGGFGIPTSPPRRIPGPVLGGGAYSPSRTPGSPAKSHSRSNSTAPLYTTAGRIASVNDGREIRNNSDSSGGSSRLDPREDDSERQRLNQLMQNFFSKMALVVVRSRMDVPPVFMRGTATRKINKWFNVELEETDIFREELRTWKNTDAFDNRPPPLIVETYLDASELTANQTLVVMDEAGKRYNVENMLSASRSWRRGHAATDAKKEVILERWRVELTSPINEFSPELAVVYKKSIVLFRSLYAYARLLPTWKFQKRLAKTKLNTNNLRVSCRIINPERQAIPRPDPLEIALVDNEQAVTSSFEFGKVECPAGIFSINVAYRKNCDFKVDAYETLLSSHLLNLDEQYFTPSLAQRPTSQPNNTGREVPGSLPTNGPANVQRGDPSQAYGSLTSYHPAAGITSQSPISALRNMHIEGGSSNGSPSEPSSLPARSTQGSKASLRSVEGQSFSSLNVQRRPSVSFMQPFKTPSLSASPGGAGEVSASPRTSVGRISDVIGVPVPGRQRHSLGTMSPSSLRSAVVPPPEVQTASSSQESVTKPSVTRYSSSFGQRRPRLSSGASRTEEDGSSGRASFVSSHAPGSGVITDPLAMEDDKSLSDFMDLLSNKQSLRSFQATEESGKRTTKALNKFSKMKDSNAVLSDSLSSSLFLAQRSTGTASSSRQLSSVPPALSGVSVSTSSSPGKPISPHTPAIPSRLGLNETLIHDHSRDQDPVRIPEHIPSQLTERLHGSHRTPITTSTTATTSPMNIPSSPRFVQVRRSNSLSQGQTDDDASSGYEAMRPYGPEARHSTSLDSLERLPPVLLSDEASLQSRQQRQPQGRTDGPGSVNSLSPTAPQSQSPVEARAQAVSRTSDRILSGSSFSNRRPFRPSRGNTESPARPPIARTPSDTRPPPTPGSHPDDELLFNFSNDDMAAQRRTSLENERSGTAFARRGTRGSEGRGRGER